MHAKDFITIAAVCSLLCSCASTTLCSCTSTTRTDGQVLEYQRQIDKLENELRARDRAIEAGVRELESITARSSEMGADIDEIIRELDEYQHAIERLLQNYRNAKVEDTETTDL